MSVSEYCIQHCRPFNLTEAVFTGLPLCSVNYKPKMMTRSFAHSASIACTLSYHDTQGILTSNEMIIFSMRMLYKQMINEISYLVGVLGGG